MTIKKHLPSITSTLVLGGSILFCFAAGIVETIPNWRLINYYNRALTFYADTSGNGRIEPDEETKFLDDFVADVRKLPGYEDFRLRAEDIPKSSVDAKTILPLMQEYRPVPTF